MIFIHRRSIHLATLQVGIPDEQPSEENSEEGGCQRTAVIAEQSVLVSSQQRLSNGECQ
jgi:hypothetical protein